jgi:transcriptional regulator with XRE-family HTH domain
MQLTRADGYKMRKLREEADLTVEELLRALEEKEGIKRNASTIYNAELGHSQPGFKLLNAIARVLGVPREALLADEPEPSEAGHHMPVVRNAQRRRTGPMQELQGIPVAEDA